MSGKGLGDRQEGTRTGEPPNKAEGRMGAGSSAPQEPPQSGVSGTSPVPHPVPGTSQAHRPRHLAPPRRGRPTTGSVRKREHSGAGAARSRTLQEQGSPYRSRRPSLAQYEEAQALPQAPPSRLNITNARFQAIGRESKTQGRIRGSTHGREVARALVLDGPDTDAEPKVLG